MSRFKRRKSPEKEPKLERWLVSYADFITLLFAVFVMLYAMSIVDQKKMNEVQASIQASFSRDISPTPPKVIGDRDFGLIPEVLDQSSLSRGQDEASAAETRNFSLIKEEVLANLQEFAAKNEVGLTVNERGLVISLKEAGFFPSGTAGVQAQALPLQLGTLHGPCQQPCPLSHREARLQWRQPVRDRVCSIPPDCG